MSVGGQSQINEALNTLQVKDDRFTIEVRRYTPRTLDGDPGLTCPHTISSTDGAGEEAHHVSRGEHCERA